MPSADLEPRAWRIAHAGHGVDAAFRAFDGLLRSRISYDAACWTTLDPATGLFTASTMTGAPKDRETERRLYECEFTQGEPSTLLSLIERRQSVAILSEVTHGDVGRATRFEVFAPMGVTDELRAMLWVDGVAWGGVVLLRVGGCFGAPDVRAVRHVTKHAAEAVRLALLRGAAARPEVVNDPPGVLKVGRDGTLVSLTASAQQWLTRTGPALRFAVTTAAAAIRERPEIPGARSRLVTDDGQVLSIHASAMADDPDAVVVIVDKARPAEVSSLLVDAYGLTARQRDVLGRIMLGRSMSQLAHSLGISEHTAQDHRKAIYDRMGVSSRSELAALLQFEEYDPRVWGEIQPSPYGGFLE
jgi:DNA-binding CsgD family transcriptional regulator